MTWVKEYCCSEIFTELLGIKQAAISNMLFQVISFGPKQPNLFVPTENLQDDDQGT